MDDPEAIFTDIYDHNKWGGNGGFYSGVGSHDDSLTKPYVKAIHEWTPSIRGKRFVDLGCGDFAVGRQLRPLASTYIATDIVYDLIRRNQLLDPNTIFLHMDIIIDELPDGDICFVRQVLQHLSNAQVHAVLQKLTKYALVFITEHIPSVAFIPNLDKPCGCDIRLDRLGSGIVLDSPPFNIPSCKLRQVLSLANTSGSAQDMGMISTVAYVP